MLKMSELDLADKRVLIREDLNVPVQGGEVSSDSRIRAALPTLKAVRDAGARTIVMSHLGRPVEGEFDASLSLAPVVERLSDLLGQPVRLVDDWHDGVDVAPGEIVVLENIRFEVGEKKDDETLSRRLAALCDIYVMDAFGTAHRAQASTHGVARFAPVACAGPLLVAELEALGKALDKPDRPLLAIVGGAKVSTKLSVLQALIERVDQLIVGGGIANTFIAAAGHNVGRSLYEAELLDEARQLMDQARQRGAEIPVPEDVIVATELSAEVQPTRRNVDEVADDEMILDIGPRTAEAYAGRIREAGTVVWNGPVGVFEYDAFAGGTRAVSEAVAQSDAFSIAGGGDTLAAVDKFGVTGQVSYISTGGGAFLEFIEGKTLPAVAVLEARAKA